MAISIYLVIIAGISAVSAMFLRDRSKFNYESEEAWATEDASGGAVAIAGPGGEQLG